MLPEDRLGKDRRTDREADAVPACRLAGLQACSPYGARTAGVCPSIRPVGPHGLSDALLRAVAGGRCRRQAQRADPTRRKMHSGRPGRRETRAREGIAKLAVHVHVSLLFRHERCFCLARGRKRPRRLRREIDWRLEQARTSLSRTMPAISGRLGAARWQRYCVKPIFRATNNP